MNIYNTMAADGLASKGVRALAAMELTHLSGVFSLGTKAIHVLSDVNLFIMSFLLILYHSYLALLWNMNMVKKMPRYEALIYYILTLDYTFITLYNITNTAVNVHKR